MKDIDIEFVNIQSHEHTRFQLHPGLNFILAEDNNVGKSAIFKALTCAMHLPKVSSADLNELVRGGCSQARATFRYDSVVCTMWLFRDGDRTVRAFFETSVDGGSATRSLSAPGDLREALGVVMGADGKVVNFNDADTVQLIVQDTPKNDEVLSQVLVDLRVDNVKANLYKLGQQIQQDYKMAKSKLDDVTHIMSTMHYVQTVDEFNDEKDLLGVACRVADATEASFMQLEDGEPLPEPEEFSKLHAALRIYEGLCEVEVTDPAIVRAVSPELFTHIQKCIKVLAKLETVKACDIQPLPNIKPKQLENAGVGIRVFDALERATGALSFAVSAQNEAQQRASERTTLLKKIEAVSQTVVCPVKGKVFYSDEKCIPCGD